MLATVSTGRSAADQLSDELSEANLLLSDLVDEDDRASEDFMEDMKELRSAYEQVRSTYDRTLAASSEKDQTRLRKNFELAVVGLRDKLHALEDEVAA